MKWSFNYSVNVNDLDSNYILSASGILRFMQDAANREMEAHGPTYLELFESGFSFILCRIRLKSYLPVTVHDNITVETWTTVSKSLQFDRYYRMIRNGETVAEAATAWAMVGVNDKRLHRASEFDLNYVVDDALELPLPPRMKIPEGTEMKFMAERKVEYPDIDLNEHMNNTRYPDIFCGYIEGGMKGKRMTSFSISFVNEAHLGDTIKYYSGAGESSYYVRSVRSDGKTNAEAEITLESI